MATAQIRLDRNKIRNFINYGVLTPTGVMNIMNRTTVSDSRDPIVKNTNKTITPVNTFVTGILSTISTNNTLVAIPNPGQPIIDAVTAFITTAISNIVADKRNSIKVGLLIEQTDVTTKATLILTSVNDDIKSVSNVVVLSS